MQRLFNKQLILKNTLYSLGLLSITLGMFAVAFDAGFISFFDNVFVAQNWNVREGLSVTGWKYAFTTTDAGYWTPTTWLSIQSVETLQSMQPHWRGLIPNLQSAQWHHLLSVAIHSANTLLLFAFLQRLRIKPLAAFLVSAIFAMHPLNVEAVSLVAGRPMLLSGLFLLMGLNCYLKFVKQRDTLSYTKTFLSLTLAMLTHPMMLVAPALLFLLDVFLLGRSPLILAEPPKESDQRDISAVTKLSLRQLLTEKLPLIAFACGLLVMHAVFAFQAGSLVSLSQQSLLARFGQSFTAMNWTLFKLLIPTNLSVSAPLEFGLLNWSAVFIGFGILFAMCSWVIMNQHRYPAFAFSWYALILALVPVSGLFQNHHEPFADRFVYVAQIGIFVGLAVGISRLCQPSQRRQQLATGLCCLTIGLFGLQTFQQIKTWNSNETVWTHAEKVNPNNWMAKVQLGLIALEQDELASARQFADEALKINPQSLDCMAFAGRVQLASEHLRAAEVTFLTILERSPNHRDALLGMSIVHSERYEYQLAEIALQQLLESRPHDVIARMQLALLNAHQKNFYDAQLEAKIAVKSAPHHVPALKLAGRLCARQKDYEEAVEYLTRACEIFGNDVETLDLLVEVLEKSGRYQEALLYREARHHFEAHPELQMVSGTKSSF